jgi:cell division protein WhiA
MLSIAAGRAAVARAILAVAHSAGLDAHAHNPKTSAGMARWVVRIPATALTRGSQLRIATRACCRRTLLRAAFLSSGSVSDPSRGYHLEFTTKHDDAARLLCKLIALLGGDAGIARRRRHSVVYIKDAQTISMLLANLGATRALLHLEERRAVRQTKNAIRRTVNSEAANAKRAASSAARQRDAARHLVASVRLSLPRTLREAATLRIKHPSQTLRELARLSRPPISKAAMANRMRLLERLAKR